MNLLVVEDKYECAQVAKEALSPKGNVTNVYDLENALHYINFKSPDMVLTDMCFGERGINVELLNKGENLAYHSSLMKKDFDIKKEGEYFIILNRGKQEQLEDKLKFSPKNSKGRLKELEYTSFGFKMSPILAEIESKEITDKEFFQEFINFTKEEILKYNIWDEFKGQFEEWAKGNLKLNPPMGYYVIKKSKEKDIPVVAITSTAHGVYALPALSELNMENLLELGLKYNYREHVKYEDPVLLNSGKVIFSDKVNPEAWLLAFDQALKQKKE